MNINPSKHQVLDCDGHVLRTKFPCAAPPHVVCLIAEYAWRPSICLNVVCTCKAGRRHLHVCKKRLAFERARKHRAATVLNKFFHEYIDKERVCATCNKSCNGLVQWHDHLAGRMHKARVPHCRQREAVKCAGSSQQSASRSAWTDHLHMVEDISSLSDSLCHVQGASSSRELSSGKVSAPPPPQAGQRLEQTTPSNRQWQ